MKILIDLQAAQGGSQHRGIGRYAKALARAIVRNRGEHEVFLLLNELFDDSINLIEDEFSSILPPQHVAIFAAPRSVEGLLPSNAWRRQAAELAREWMIKRISPDVLLLMSLFEGGGDNSVTSIGKLTNPKTKTAVIVYDLIPFIDPEPYIGGTLEAMDWYYSKIAHLRKADLLLAISDSARHEAIDLLGVDRSRVETIYSAADERFQPLALSDAAHRRFLEKMHIRRPFVMHASAFEPRKNFEGLIRAYGLLPQRLRAEHQLVLLASHGRSEAPIRSIAGQAGLDQDDVVVLEHVSDEDLVALYSTCTLFVFPSLHEGFGLPALEAMCCGAAVIGSSTTSIPEVIGREDALFDPSCYQSIASVMQRALCDEAFRKSLKTHGIQQVKRFSWDKTALLALEAIHNLHQSSPPLVASGDEDVSWLWRQIENIETPPVPTDYELSLISDCIVANERRKAELDAANRDGISETKLAPPPISAECSSISAFEMPLGQVLRPTAFSSRARQILSFGMGWYPAESWGIWMKEAFGGIRCRVEGNPGDKVRIILQFQAAPWAENNVLLLRSSCGGQFRIGVPESGRVGQPYPDFIAWLDCVIDERQGVALFFELEGEIPEPWWGETRRYCIGLLRLLCLPGSVIDEAFSPAEFIRPVALTGPTGSRVAPCGSASLVMAMRNRTVLADGWHEPEPWGTRTIGKTARISVKTKAPPDQELRVAVQLRCPAGWTSEVVARSACGAVGRYRTSEDSPRDFVMWIDCRANHEGRVEITLEAKAVPAGSNGNSTSFSLGMMGLAYAARDSLAERLTVAECLLSPQMQERTSVIRATLEAGLRFTVVGHVNGSYSLAAVNRRMAAVLETAKPGSVRVEQVEGNPVHDFSLIPSDEIASIASLTQCPSHDEGPVVEISQHWPVWVSPHPADLKLASVAWEESLLPSEMVRTLNQNFHGVLVWTRFVAKVLIDSGVRLPIRIMGYAPDLEDLIANSEEPTKTAVPSARDEITPFTFLHISSCFPRKGVDTLLSAYRRAFRRSDPVRLVIKGFPNQHNDVAEQISRLRSDDPEGAEIVLINRELSRNEIASLYAGANAAVLPTRGEGFNIPAAEALAAGLPLIVTGYSGQNDFADPDVARHVGYRFAPSGSHLHSPGSVWAEPDVEDLAAAMREHFDAVDDPITAREITERVQRGRQRARIVGDGDRWASRIRDIALDLLLEGDKLKSNTAAPKVAWVSTWNISCGIANYSRYLLECYPDAERDIMVLCDERTAPSDQNTPGLPPARVAWRAGDPASCHRLAREIAATRASVVVIQYQPGLIFPESLLLLLRDSRLSDLEVVLTLHNIRDLTLWDNWPLLVDAFRSIARILVHTVDDLNILKESGVVDNATLFPMGALASTVEQRPARDLPTSSAPVIGSYGFFLPNKGIDTLIEAFAEVRSEWPHAKLRLVNAEYPLAESRVEIERCRALARLKDVEHAIEWHTDYLPDAESVALLSQCDLVAFPRRPDRPESSSAAIRSAMAARVPVLVTPVSIFSEFGDEVLRADGVDSPAFAAAIARTLRDRQMRQENIDKIDQWLQGHKWAHIAERLFGVISSVVINTGVLSGKGV